MDAFRLKREPLNCMNEIKLLQEQNMDLAKQLGEIKSKLDKFEGYKKVEQRCSKEIYDNNQRIGSSLVQDQEMVKKLQKDNDELQAFIKVQRLRIEELSNRASNLAKQIEKTPQVPSTKIDYENRNVKKNLCFVDDFSKKNRFTNRNISSTTTDYSTTVLEFDSLTEDDIIQEAKFRLKFLEINTVKIEQNSKNFQINCSRNNIDFKLIRDNRKSYNKICSKFSDDSDLDALKHSSNKINIKELANKIGYHRSIRRSMNHFIGENYIYKESPVNKVSSRTESPIKKSNDSTEISLNRSNISTQLPKVNKLQIESDATNTLLPDINSEVENNDNVDSQLFKHTEIIDSPHSLTSVQRDSSNGVDTLSTSKKMTRK
ncbi:hypothetical protein QTP88_023669 [Uroleucon formosanum]